MLVSNDTRVLIRQAERVARILMLVAVGRTGGAGASGTATVGGRLVGVVGVPAG